MGNKSSKKKSSERPDPSNPKQENQYIEFESPLGIQDDPDFAYKPFGGDTDSIRETASSPIKRIQGTLNSAHHVIKKHGFFGTIRRKMSGSNAGPSSTIPTTPPTGRMTSLFRKYSDRMTNSAKPTRSKTELNTDDQTNELKQELQTQSVPVTPMKSSNRTMEESFMNLEEHNKSQSHNDVNISLQIVVEAEKFDETFEDYTLNAVESTNEELLNNEIESGQDIIQNSINFEISNLARDIVENTFIGAFSEMQRLVDTDEIDNKAEKIGKNLVFSKSNASLSEDQYSGQLSSRNNTPAKIRKLSENQQIFNAQSPLTKQLENECKDSDVESPNEPKIFEHEPKATESREFLAETVETAETVEAVEAVKTRELVESIDETVVFQNSFVYTESAEFIETDQTKSIRNVQSIITPAVKPENVNMHDISEWSVDESRELIPRPSVREDLSRTTMEARQEDKRETIKDNLEVYKLLHEQAIAKEQIYHEIMSFNDKFENRYEEKEEEEQSEKSTMIQHSFPPISLKKSKFQELGPKELLGPGEVKVQLEHDFDKTKNQDSEENDLQLVAETSNETIMAPLTTIETYLPTLLSSDSLAFTMNETSGGIPDYIHDSNELIARESSSISNVSVSKTSQESNDSNQTIGRTMNRTADMTSISMAKERAAGHMDDTRVIVSQTTQNEASKRSRGSKGVTGKAATNATTIGIEKPSEISKNTTSQPPADVHTLSSNMKNSKLSTPKVNCKIEDLDDSQIYETPIGGNKMENSFSNISETTSRCETPTTKPSGNSLTGSPSNNKKKRSNRKRNKNKGGAKVKAN